MGHHFSNMLYPSMSYNHGWQAVFLYPFVSGHESVIFFFLLSGFVLSLPLLHGRNQPYSVFLRRRILRIYGPYLGALALSLVGCTMWNNQLGTTGWAAKTWYVPVRLESIVDHVLFIGNYDYSQYNTAFWSLVYEMRISIIFPLLFVIANKLKTRYTVLTIGIFTLIGVRPSPDHKFLITFEYAGVFLVGALLAKNLSSLKSLYGLLSMKMRALLAIASFSLYIGGHHIVNIGPLWHLGDMPIALGAAGLLLIGLNSAMACRVLNTPVLTFLGRISYSFYLVHGTILFAMAAILEGRVSGAVFLLMYLPTAILISWGFYIAVEKPFMAMSQKVGKHPPSSAVEPAMAAD